MTWEIKHLIYTESNYIQQLRMCMFAKRNLMSTYCELELKGARAQKIGLKGSYLKIWFR